MKSIFKFLVSTLIVLSIFACNGSDDSNDADDTSSNTRTTKPGADFISGDEVDLKTKTIDDLGGTISVNSTGTFLDGTSIIFPPGSLQNSTDITVGYDSGSLSLPDGTSPIESKTLNLRVTGDSNFLQPVEVTIPYTEENAPTPFYIDSNNHLRPVLVTGIDRTNKTFTFVTTHASLWTWVVDLFTDSPDQDSGFRSADDGFKIANRGSLVNSGGECFGMTTFAQWYYDEQMETKGEFYNKYMNFVGRDAIGNNLTGQDVIATRAFSAANQSWNWSEYILPNINTDDEYRYNAIVTALKTTQRPVNLSIKRVNSEGEFVGGHAVLAFGVDEDDGQLFIYDPNYPGQTREIIYDVDEEEFQQYGNYSRFFLNGTGTYDLRESYENILEDADHNFTSDNNPQISITSHQNGDTIYTRVITLTGEVESSEVLIKTIEVFLENEKFSTNVDNEGNFSLEISLNVGEQTFRFVTKDSHGNIISPNNMDTDPFSLIVDLDTSVMLVTLTWDKYDTDLDLYVIDPMGDYSCYYNKNTADGGELDIDIIEGYGPEHWTLSSNDIIRWNQEYYTVRVHYYNDHGNGGTNFKLSVLLYEGSNREVEYIKTGYLSVNNEDNNGPSDIGADWAEFTFPIVLSTNSGKRSTTSRTQSLSKLPVITTEIPDPEFRRTFKEK